jgi:hypothetical protein
MREWFEGKLLRNGAIVFDPVCGEIWNEQPDPRKTEDWAGEMTVGASPLIQEGGTYRLELDDGRAADIIIAEVTHSPGSDQFVKFHLQTRLC